MIKYFKNIIKLGVCKYSYNKLNRNKNSAYVNSCFPIENVEVGKGTYGPLNIVWMAPRTMKIKIGNYVSIGPKVTFLGGGEHNYRRISTYPFQSKVYYQKSLQEKYIDIVVEDDVWIGYDSLIMSGVTIGKGAVIGARSVVAKDVPPYSIFVGNKVIGKRFSDEIIKKLMRIDYSAIDHSINDGYGALCQCELTEENVDSIIERFCHQ